MSQSSGFDMSKVPTGEKLVGGAAALYIIWVFIPTWYSCCNVEGLGSIGSAGVERSSDSRRALSEVPRPHEEEGWASSGLRRGPLRGGRKRSGDRGR